MIVELLEHPEGQAAAEWCASQGLSSLAEFLVLPLPVPYQGLQSRIRLARQSLSRCPEPGSSPPVWCRPLMDGLLTDQVRWVLACVGGVAGSGFLVDRLTELSLLPHTPRRLRAGLKTSRKIQQLGAGYFALMHVIHEPVLYWAERCLRQAGPVPVDRLVQEILQAYPHGGAVAIRAWIHQDPGRLQVDRGIVRVLPVRKR